MLFPIGDDQVKGGYRPYVSYSLIALNVIGYFLQNLDPNGYLYVMDYGSIPAEISSGEDLYTLFTSMFMHGGFMHLLGNMIFLWVFADNIEATIGSKKFLAFYVLAGLAASAMHIVLDPSSPIPCVGASGAIAGVMGGYIIMFPRSRILMIFLIGFFTFRINALYFLGFWILQQMVNGLGAINAQGSIDSDAGGVAYWAHIGGFVFGLLIGYYFRNHKPDPMLIASKNQEPIIQQGPKSSEYWKKS